MNLPHLNQRLQVGNAVVIRSRNSTKAPCGAFFIARSLPFVGYVRGFAGQFQPTNNVYFKGAKVCKPQNLR